MSPVASEKLSTVATKYLAPPDPVGHPPPEKRARDGADAGGEQDHPRLEVRQLPIPDDKCEDVADQEEVEEIEQVAKDRSGDDLPLVDRQALLPL
jgi:hypothetical protein